MKVWSSYWGIYLIAKFAKLNAKVSAYAIAHKNLKQKPIHIPVLSLTQAVNNPCILPTTVYQSHSN